MFEVAVADAFLIDIGRTAGYNSNVIATLILVAPLVAPPVAAIVATAVATDADYGFSTGLNRYSMTAIP